MSKLEEVLPGSFFRVHRSAIVNIDHIDRIEGNTVYLGAEEILISQNKKVEFLNYIDQADLLS